MISRKIKTNEPLSRHTTLKIGGPALLFAEAHSQNELKDYINLARQKKKTWIVIGEGSNLLVSDMGFDGFVIANKIEGVQMGGGKVLAKAGTRLQKLVDETINHGLSGMEKMAGIPGSVGGAIFGNAGAYGQAISDHIVRVKVLKGDKMQWLAKKDCRFAYRESIFKKTKDVILESEFRFERGNPAELQRESKEILKARLKKYMSGIKCPGSFFKNLEVNKIQEDILAKIPADKIVYGKIPAGYLLEEVGAKGASLGRIKVADYHGNLFMNLGGGKASDFFRLAQRYQAKVKEKFGIELEPEVQLVGFGKNVAVVGFGMEGKDLTNYLLSQNARLTVLDKKEEGELDFSGIDKSKITLKCGKDYLAEGLTGFDTVFRSPGVYRYLPEVVEAENAGVEISSAIKLFFGLSPAKIIGVTGTKGKGTTATLIYQIIKKGGLDAYLAGNIGVPYLSLLPKLTKNSWIVLELSSFQLIDLTKSPHIAVVLNVTADHLDWHKDIKEYVEAKKNVVRYQGPEDFAVINEEYDTPRNFAKETKAKVIFFSKEELDEGFKKERLLRGEHNLENITAAASVARILKVDDKTIRDIVSEFKGLEHRLEFVAKVKTVSFYNDSFATGPQPTIAAIKSFTEPTTIIVGGSEKGLDYSELGKVIARSANVKNVILIGLIGPKVGVAIREAGGKVNIIDTGTRGMEEIVKKSFEVTPKGGIVLLSPAAASFDMFKNYKDRGEQFKKAVLALKNGQ